MKGEVVLKTADTAGSDRVVCTARHPATPAFFCLLIATASPFVSICIIANPPAFAFAFYSARPSPPLPVPPRPFLSPLWPQVPLEGFATAAAAARRRCRRCCCRRCRCHRRTSVANDAICMAVVPGGRYGGECRMAPANWRHRAPANGPHMQIDKCARLGSAPGGGSSGGGGVAAGGRGRHSLWPRRLHQQWVIVVVDRPGTETGRRIAAAMGAVVVIFFTRTG